MITVPVPEIQTERLTLRGHATDDFPDCAAMWSDAAVTHFLAPNPLSQEEVWARLLRYVGHWALMGFGYWAVRETATGRFVGDVGFADYRRDITPPLAGAPEIGWVLASGAQGRGFATEAVRAAITWGETRFSGARTVCLIDPGNRPSLRVAEKCGYHQYAHASYKGQATLLLER